MTRTLVGLLVGSHFVPPAKTVLAHLPGGASLQLVPDPENPYDANAIRVYLDPENIPSSQYEALQAALPLQGATLEQVMSSGPIILGHVGASQGKPLAKAKQAWPEMAASLVGNLEFLDWCKDPDHVAQLGFGPAGDPMVMLTVPEPEEELT